MTKVGYSQDACQSMVKSVEKNGNEMVGIETVKYYQGKIVDPLITGWITNHGKDYIDNTIVKGFNTNLKKMANALQRYADYMEQIATKVAVKADSTDPYQKVSPKIIVGQFSSEGSRAYIEIGDKKFHSLDNDALQTSIDAINQFIENRMKKNHDEIVKDWGQYSFAFEANGASLAEEWKTAFNSAYNSAMNDLEALKTEMNRVINSKKEETEEARANAEQVKSFQAGM